MVCPEKTIALRDGRNCVLRVPRPDDAQALIEYMRITAMETEYLTRTAEEVCDDIEAEELWIRSQSESPLALSLLAEVDGEIAGSCSIQFHGKQRMAHRAGIGIALVRKFWGLGIGTAMLGLLLEEADRRAVCQVELEVVEDNVRAIRLYEKMGFSICARLLNGLRCADGSLHAIMTMIRNQNRTATIKNGGNI